MTTETEHDVDLEVPDYCGETPESVQRRVPNVTEMLDRARGVDAVEEGFCFTFPGDADTLETVARFALRERACCPMGTFELAFGGPDEPVRLTVRAPEPMREDMRETLGLDERFEL